MEECPLVAGRAVWECAHTVFTAVRILLISVVPPIFPQFTDAGLAMPAEVGDTVFIAVTVAVRVVK
jgi:hypothetical protein